MKRYILDTNSFSDLVRGKEPLSSRVIDAGECAYLTVITVQEALAGWYSLIRKAKTPEQLAYAYEQLARTAAQCGRVAMMTMTVNDIRKFDWLKNLKLNIGGDDLRIAAIALNNNATIVTANTRDFERVPGLSIEDWTQSALSPR